MVTYQYHTVPYTISIYNTTHYVSYVVHIHHLVLLWKRHSIFGDKFKKLAFGERGEKLDLDPQDQFNSVTEEHRRRPN